jgi:hypothetical protein
MQLSLPRARARRGPVSLAGDETVGLLRVPCSVVDQKRGHDGLPPMLRPLPNPTKTSATCLAASQVDAWGRLLEPGARGG